MGYEMSNCLSKQNTESSALAGRKRAYRYVATVLSAVCLSASMATSAGTLEQAKRIHDRIAGVPPTEDVLLDMKAALDADASVGGFNAAMIALEDDNFYNVTLKNWVAPWTNEEQTAFVALNDYTATVIGIVRDETDYRQVLYGDILYIGDPALGLPGYANNNNSHYEALEDGGYSLKDNLVLRSQASVTGLPADATAGVVTSRAAAKAFFSAGTNRANFRFTLLNHLCMDLEQVNDTSRVPDRVRQDVSRSPGGDARIFLNSCVGCHAGMDPLTQAFAYYDYEYDADNDPTGENGAIDYNAEGEIDEETGTRVKEKYLINSTTFAYGYVTTNDQWDNYWRVGQNKALGWDEELPGSGQGARTMLQELAHTQAFAQCAVKKVFKTVCLRDPADAPDRSQVDTMVSSFNSNHNLKTTFAEAANYCKGE